MIRIGICDDSPEFLHQIKNAIKQWKSSSQYVITEFFEDGDALLSEHFKNPFDIILLDVVMPLLGGIEAAKELREKDKSVKIVFITSSPEYAVDSYSVKASNYLLKPLEKEKLFICLNELIEEIQNVSKALTIKGLDATHKIPVSSIEFVESQSKHIIFYTTHGKVIESTDPLYTYENTLDINDGFFKCHRSYIVNIHHIDSYSSSEVVMHSGCRVPISRSRHKDFEEVYFRVVFEKAGDNFD